MIKIKRVYEKPDRADGFRILVDRMWPRGLKKDEAKVDAWLKDIAPSAELRKWFGHEPGKCAEFRNRYFRELKGKGELVSGLSEKGREGTVTLLYGAKYEACNNATVLKEFLEKKA
ncbi:MAG: DUF488 domain-containing protein [Nitrospiraceae bacterium]|nr:DUF488 domain-containing protein [Nitrospiraceae bacterium]